MKHRLTGLILAMALALDIMIIPAAFRHGGLLSPADLILEVSAEDDVPAEQPQEDPAETDDEEFADEEIDDQETEDDAEQTAEEETEENKETDGGIDPDAETDREVTHNGIPVVVIYIDETEGHTIDDMNASEDHSVECYGSIEIIVPEGFTYCDMDVSPSSLGPVEIEYIRGRGHSTWFSEKKPYKIKLSKKAGLLGMAKNKHWVLLAGTYDPTGFKNRMSGHLGDAVQMEYTPNGVSVDVVMVAEKDGEEYARFDLGNYLLAEQVRVDENRVDIPELTADDIDPEDITGGYLVQFGSQVMDDDPDKFYTERGINLANDTPTFDPDDPDYTNETQKEYIRGYIQSMEDALFGKGVTDGDPYTDQNGIRYTEYMDMESAAKYWLIQEASGNADMYKTGSNYFYKTADRYDESGNLVKAGKLYWGPLWDFDQAWGDPEQSSMNYKGFHFKNDWLLAMTRDDDPEGFRETVKRVWPDVRDELLGMIEDGGLLDQYYSETEASWLHDYDVWKDIISRYHYQADFLQNKEDVKTYIRLRVSWMDDHILRDEDTEYPCLDDAVKRVTYIADGEVIRREYYEKNVYCDLFTPGSDNKNVYIPEKEGYTFVGWKDEDGMIITSEQEITEDRFFYAYFVKEEEVIYAESIRFRSDQEWSYLDYIFFTSVYTILPYEAMERSAVWTSSDPDIAAVDQNGRVKMFAVGKVMITATLKSGASASYQLTILDDAEAMPEDLELITDHLELKPGEYGFIDYRIIPEYSCFDAVYYYTADPHTARVDGSGVVTGIKPGTTQIVVGIRYYDEDWQEHTIEKICTVTVTGSQTAVITYRLAGGTYNGSTADIEETHTVGDVIRVHEAPSRTGYAFLYWQGSQYQPGDSYTVTEDHTFTAVWKENTPEDGSGETPPTGDSSRIALWSASLLFACAVIAWASFLFRNDEE